MGFPAGGSPPLQKARRTTAQSNVAGKRSFTLVATFYVTRSGNRDGRVSFCATTSSVFGCQPGCHNSAAKCPVRSTFWGFPGKEEGGFLTRFPTARLFETGPSHRESPPTVSCR